jgi:hypothetical protein
MFAFDPRTQKRRESDRAKTKLTYQMQVQLTNEEQ